MQVCLNKPIEHLLGGETKSERFLNGSLRPKPAYNLKWSVKGSVKVIICQPMCKKRMCKTWI